MVTPEGQGRMLLRPGVFAGRNNPGEKWIRQERKGDTCGFSLRGAETDGSGHQVGLDSRREVFPHLWGICRWQEDRGSSQLPLP